MLLLRIALAALFVCSFSPSAFGQGSISCSADDVVLEVPTPHRVSRLERSGDLVAANGNDGTLFYSVDSELTPTFLSEILDTGVGVFGEEGAGQYYFVTGNDQMLNVYDVSDPKVPSKIGQFDLQDRASRMEVEGDYLYLLFTGQLRILDISDPSSPETVSVVAAGEQAWDLRVEDGLLVAAHGSDEIQVFDVQDPLMPVLVSEPDINANSVLIHAGVLVTSYYDRLGLYDMSDPDSPKPLGEYFGEQGAIVAHGTSLWISVGPYIEEVDISEPTKPTRVSWYATGSYFSSPVLQDDNMLVADSESALTKLDISNPSNPRPTHYDVDLDELGSVLSRFEVGEVAYFVSDNGVFAADTSDPDPHGPFVPVTMLSLHDACVVGNRVVGDFSEGVLVAYDLSDPYEPVELSHHSMGGGDIHAIAFSGDKVCASTFFYGEILTMSDSGALSSYGKNNLLSAATDMAMQDDYVYGNFGSGMLACLDISDPVKPHVVWESDTLNPYFIHISGGYLYCDDGQETAYVLDISVPTSPVVLSETTLPSTVYAMDLHDDKLFLSVHGYDVMVYDVFDPSSPQLIGTYGPDALDRPWEDRLPYTVDSDRAYHIDYNGGVLAYDITPQCNDCQADVNGDGSVTPDDFMSWINAFNNNLPSCDQNGDGSCSPADFTAWIANYNAGC